MHHLDSTSFLCWGCLSSGRNKSSIKYDIHQFLYDVIGDNKILAKELSAMEYCWECIAMFAKLIRFRNQVKASYAAMKNCLANNLDIAALEKPSKIKIHPVINISCNNLYLPELGDSMSKPTKVEDRSFEDDHLASPDQISDDNNYLETPLTKRKKKFKKKKKKRDYISEKYTEVELSKEEIEEEREVFSSREEFVNAHFKCLSCLDIFANADDFKDHNEGKHTVVTAHKCDICQNYLNSEVSLTYHGYTHARRYVCTICGKRSNTKRMAERHYDETHFVPDICADDQTTEEDNKQTDDLLNAQNGTENLYTCQHCSKKFKWKTSLHRHIMVHEIADGRKRQPYCEACGLSFTSTPNLRNHIKTSSKHQIQLKLMKLKESQNHSEGDVEEIRGRIVRKMQGFPCDMCDKSFQWRGNLVRHQQSHATKASRELVCAPCNRTFSSIATYKQHMQISKKHVSELEFKYTCSDCGKKFPVKQKLKDHINWEHLKNYVYNCDKCDKVFKHRLNLQQHSQVHNRSCGEHLCHQCGKAFPNKSKLSSHVLAVHCSSPLACALCGAKFGWRSCLARHVKRIHGNKPSERT